MSSKDIRPIPRNQDDLTASERKLFNERFFSVFEWGKTLWHPVQFWREFYKDDTTLNADYWIDVLEGGLSTKLKKLLSQSEPPTIAQMLAVGLEKNGRIGSYMKLAIAVDESLPNIGYVGFSATTTGGELSFGVKRRIMQHRVEYQNDDS